MIEVTTFKKNYLIYFISRDEYETIAKTKNGNCRVRGEITTNKQEYSTDFLMRWLEFGFIKIYKQVNK